MMWNAESLSFPLSYLYFDTNLLTFQDKNRFSSQSYYVSVAIVLIFSNYFHWTFLLINIFIEIPLQSLQQHFVLKNLLDELIILSCFFENGGLSTTFLYLMEFLSMEKLIIYGTEGTFFHFLTLSPMTEYFQSML